MYVVWRFSHRYMGLFRTEERKRRMLKLQQIVEVTADAKSVQADSTGYIVRVGEMVSDFNYF